MSLVTLADMKTYLGITGTDYDVFLTEQLELVSDSVEGYCNRKFAQDTYTEKVYADDITATFLKDIFLFNFPVISVTTIKEKANDADTGTDITADCRVHLPTARITNTNGLFRTGKLLEVEYSAGYAVVPSVVLSVVKSVVSERYNKKVNGIDLNFGSDIQSISIPGTLSIAYDYSLASNEKKSAFGNILGNNLNLLDPYRSDRAVRGGGHISYVS